MQRAADFLSKHQKSLAVNDPLEDEAKQAESDYIAMSATE
ncbi:hypothetical protein OURE66S_00477 [Oligella ureolytica]